MNNANIKKLTIIKQRNVKNQHRSKPVFERIENFGNKRIPLI